MAHDGALIGNLPHPYYRVAEATCSSHHLGGSFTHVVDEMGPG